MLRIPQASRWLAVIALPLQAAILYLLDEKLDANWYGLRRKLSPPHDAQLGFIESGWKGARGLFHHGNEQKADSGSNRHDFSRIARHQR